MRAKTFLCCPLVAAFFLFGCSTTKKVDLDPVTIRDKAPGAIIYQGSYPRTTDIMHTKLDVSFDWDSAYVFGKATITARPYFYPSQTAVLNANGFRINKVALLKNEQLTPLRYSYDGKLLSIHLDRVYSNDQDFTLYIDYVAMPHKLKVGSDIGSNADRGLYFINRNSKDLSQKQIWTQGETECNSNWFPTINGPQEKMTQEISITVPEQFTTLSNGDLEFSGLNGNGTRTDNWRMEKPHSTYLTMLAVGDFLITKDKWRDIEVNYYMEPQFAPNAKLIFGKTPEMMDYYSKITGIDYPWEKYSQIVVRDFVSGAMENTTATVFFDQMNMTEGQYLDQNYEDIVAHELFHHWFGDLVTTESWANLPLNESFATYGEYLWLEHKYGREAADMHGLNDQLAYLGAKKSDLDLIRYDYTDREQMFDVVTYQKGGRILHMLRKTVGDAAFFKALNIYLTRHSYQSVEIHDLRLAFEEVTGKDMNWFFNQWFLASGHPVLNIVTDYDAAGKQAMIHIRQLQDLNRTPLYTIPIAVDIYSEGKVRREQIVLSRQEQTFKFLLGKEPDLINVDAEKYLLGEKIEAKPLGQLVFQYENAPLFMDRFEALHSLVNYKKDAAAREVFLEALNDTSWLIRQFALELLPELTAADKEAAYPLVRKMALEDERSYVRAAAVGQLRTTFAAKDNGDILKRTAKDKAPSVVKATAEPLRN